MMVHLSTPRSEGTTEAGLCVLVAEDDPHVQSLLRLCLEGHSVTVTGTAAMACAALAEKCFDVVITDLRLPDMGGEVVAQRASAMPSPAFVVLMTGSPSAGPQSPEELSAAGVNARLQKPFLPRELKAMMETVKRSRSRASPD